jgi:hypothetical protein
MLWPQDDEMLHSPGYVVKNGLAMVSVLPFRYVTNSASVKFSWNLPVFSRDGSALGDPAGYMIFRGFSPGDHSRSASRRRTGGDSGHC